MAAAAAANAGVLGGSLHDGCTSAAAADVTPGDEGDDDGEDADESTDGEADDGTDFDFASCCGGGIDGW